MSEMNGSGFTPTWIRWYNAADGEKIACVGGKGAFAALAYGSTSYAEFHAEGKPPHPEHGGFQWGFACSPTSRTIGLDVDYEDQWDQTATGRYLGDLDELPMSWRQLDDGRTKCHVPVIVPPELLHLWPRQLPVKFGHVKSNGFTYMEGIHHSGGAYVLQFGLARPWIVADEALMQSMLADNGNVLHADSPAASDDDFEEMATGWTDPDGRYASSIAAMVLGDWQEGTRNDSLPRRCGIIKAAGEKGEHGMRRLFLDLCAEYDIETRRGDEGVYQAFRAAYPAYGKVSALDPFEALPHASLNGHAPASGSQGVAETAVEDDPGTGLARPRKPGLDPLVAVILAAYEFARDTGGELFALPGPALAAEPYIPLSFLNRDVVNLGHDTWRGMSKRWNKWLGDQDEKTQKELGFAALTPSDTTVRNAVSHLEALGMRHGRKVTAALRAVQVAGGIVLDLGDDTGQVAYVTADGWDVRDPRQLPFPAPVFRRSVGYLPLPAPVRGGDLGELWRILRVTDDTVRSLCEGWLNAAFFADVPRPGLWPTGAPGSGKTTLGGALARLADGTDWLDGRLDKSDERNNIIRAAKHYVVSFDNMTGVTADVSDWICTLVTGHTDTFRKMRTNFDDVSMAYKRTFVATGLSLPYGLGADALDRIIEVPLEQVTEASRAADEQIRRELDDARPRLLGALLDHVVKVMGMLPHIPAQGAELGRMNGYARILIAHDLAYGTSCLADWGEAVRRVRTDKADGEPVVVAVQKLFTDAHGGYLPANWWCACGQQHPHQRPAAAVTWEGTPTQLYGALPRVGEYWPGDARAMTGKLTELDSVLRASGFTVTRHRTGSARFTRITRLGGVANAAGDTTPI